MITEEQAEAIVERLVSRIEQANTYFLQSIGSSVKKIRELTPSQAHELVQILKYGGSYEEIVKKLAKYTGMNLDDIDAIFSNYAKKDLNFAKQFYEYKDIPFTPFEQNEAFKRQIKALSNIAKNEMYDFTRNNVLGYSINGKFYNLRDTYNQLLDEALLNVGQGKETFDSAMTRIMKDIGGNGLRTVDFASGRSMRLDSKVRMDLKARLRELHNETQQIIGEEIGTDGVEISVHGNPAPDHAPVQGRQFSNEEFTKLQSGDNAKDYKGTTYNLDHDAKNGYRPISELNCYHYVFSIVLGVSKPEYDDKQLQKIINDTNKKVKIDGKEYTKYECTQLQRNLERKIREQKDIQILAKSSDNKELIMESQAKITQLTQKYKEISEKSGLPTKMDRLKVSGYTLKGRKKPIEEYKKYDDSEETFIKNNPSVVLKEKNRIIDEWTSDGGGYHSNSGITKYMREDREQYKHEGWEQGIRELDAQINGKLNENIITYRTVQIPVKELKAGQIIDDKTFIATSLSEYNSSAAFSKGDAYSSTIEIKVNKGTRCLYIGDKTGHGRNENELLFPPEYEIKITSIKKEFDADGDYIRTVVKGKMVKKK